MATTKRSRSTKNATRPRAAAAHKSRATRTLNTDPRSLALAVGAALLPWGTAHALPTGENVVAGDVTVTRPTSQSMQINQATQKGIVNWNSFSIGASEHVNISQLNATSVLLNRVVGNNPSEIFGRLTANGQVFLVNPNGVLFAPGASVEVGSLFASTLSISNQDFLAGRYQFSREGDAGSVVNQGTIITADGYTALVGPQVRNDGVIIARKGTVALAAADRVSLDLIGDGLISINVEQAALNASVVHTGRIEADGGQVLLSARSANALLDTVINTSGVIRANSLIERNGEIVLDGGGAGVVAVSGTLQAAGVDAGTTGGTIKILGDKVGLFGDAVVDASGHSGGGTVLVGGNFQGQGPEQNASMNYIGSGTSINADANVEGNGGQVIVWSDNMTRYFGTITARGGAVRGDGGFVEVSGKQSLSFNGNVDTRAPNGKTGTLLLDPNNIVISATGPTDADFIGINNDDGNANIYGFDENDNNDPAVIDPATVVAQLNTTNVTLQALNDITVAADGAITATAGNFDLALQAGNTITVNAAITTRGGDISLSANDNGGASASGAGSIVVNAALSTNGGGGTGGQVQLTINGGTGSVALNAGANITTGDAAVTISSGTGGVTQNAASTVTTGTGAISVDGNGGAIDMAGMLTTDNATGSAVTVQDATTVVLGNVNATSGGMVLGVAQNITAAVTQNVGTILNVGSLTVSANSSVGLTNANTISTLGSVQTNGLFSLTNDQALDVTAGINSGAGGVTLNVTTGALTIQAAGDITAGDAVSLTGAGGISTAGDVTTTADAIDFNSDTTLTGAVALVSAGGNVSFDGTLDGGQDLTITAGAGDVTFTGAVGAGTRLGALSIVSADDVSAGAVTAASLSQTTGTGTTSITGAIDTNAAGGVSITNETITLGSTITTAGNGGVTLNQTVGTLTLGAGNDISSDGAVSLTGATGISTAGDVTTTADAIDFNSDTTLTGAVALVSAGGNVSFDGTLDGGQDLTITAGAGDVTFTGAVGAGARLGTLSIVSADDVTAAAVTAAAFNQTDGTGTTTLNGAVNTNTAAGVTIVNETIAVNSSITTTNNGVVTLNADTATLTIAAAGDISADGAVSLTGATGISTAGNVTTTNDAVNLTSATTLTGSVVIDAGGGGVTFSSTLAGAQALTVNSSGTTAFGSTVNIGSLTTDALGSTTLAANVTTTGSQTYGDAVSAGTVSLSGTTITATNPGNDFTGVLDVNGTSASITDANALAIDANLSGNLTTNSGALTYQSGLQVGSLNSTASGTVTQTGPITVSGAGNINAGANAITLTSANDFQGVLSLTGGTTQVTDANALTLGTLNTGALIVVNTGALNLGTGTINGALSATSGNGNITQTSAIVVTGTSTLTAGTGSITLTSSNDFQGIVSGGGTGGISLVDVNTLTLGGLNAGSGVVNLTANAIAGGGPVDGGSGVFTSDTNVIGLVAHMSGQLAVTGSATLWNFGSGSTANPFARTSDTISVQVNGVTQLASLVQLQTASVIGDIAAQVGATIVEEANKTFGTDSVAEDVEYGFAGEIGATPPMDHRIDESGISLPACVQESREGLPCK